MMRKQTLFVLTMAWICASDAIGAPSSEDRNGSKGFFFDVAVGWAATRGNDVQVGDRTSIGSRGRFDEETTFEPLITRMKNDYMPFARAGYDGEKWGIQAESWRLKTGGSLDGSFSNTGRGRDELVRVWEIWNGEDEDQTNYAARNDLSLYSLRFDLTRAIARKLTLAVGLHAVRYENERAEDVVAETTPIDPFDFLLPFGPPITDSRKGRSRVHGWLVGPSVALRGGSSLGSSARVGFCLAQSVLFTDLNSEASWRREVSPPSPFDPVIALDTSVSSRAAVPVSDLRGSLTFDIGEHVSVGVFALVSVWYDLPLARELLGPLEKWTEPRSTLVFASVGPVVKVRF